MQLLRGGGVKRRTQETHQTEGDKIRELRAQIAKDKDAKVKGGKGRRQATGALPTRRNSMVVPKAERRPVEQVGSRGRLRRR